MLERTLVSYSSVGATATLWFLVALSVVSVAVYLERLVRRRLDRTDPRLLEALERTPTWDAGLRERLARATGLEARVLNAGAGAAEVGGPAAAEDALAAELMRARDALSTNLIVLGTIGANAPFIGLFGTVLGVLRAFGDLSRDTQGGAEAVMGGISEALVATAVGLFVAIPAVVLFNGLTRRNERVLERLTAIGHQIVGASRTAPRGGA